MSAPAEALSKFWEDLREKSRTRIEHPDLPDALKSVAGELVASLWTNAQATAHESMIEYRNEAQAAVLQARNTADVAAADLDAERIAVEGIREQLELAGKQLNNKRTEPDVVDET